MQFCNCEHLHFLIYIKLSITISCKSYTIYKGGMFLSDYPIFQVLDMKYPVLGRGVTVLEVRDKEFSFKPLSFIDFRQVSHGLLGGPAFPPKWQ